MRCGRCGCAKCVCDELAARSYLSHAFGEREAAATVAARILRRMAGKYAERPADVYDVITLAEWLLGLPQEGEEE